MRHSRTYKQVLIANRIFGFCQLAIGWLSIILLGSIFGLYWARCIEFWDR